MLNQEITLNILSALTGTMAGESAAIIFVNSSLKFDTSVSPLICGLNGAVILLLASASQSKLRKYG